MLPVTLPKVPVDCTKTASVASGKISPIPKAVACACCVENKLDFDLPFNLIQPL